MSKGCTWDQVRTQVRAFKATTQVAYPNQALSTIKSFYVNGSHRLLFLSNYSTDDSESRYLLLYQVDLEAEPISASDSSFPPLDPSEYLDPYLANLATVPLAKWVPVFEDYLVPDSFSSSSSSTSSSFSPFSSPFSCCPPPPPPFHATDSTTSSTPTTTRAALSTAAVPSSFSSSSTASVSFSSDSTTTTDTNDGNRRHAIQGISRYKVRNNKVLFSFAGDLFLGELNHLPILIPSQPSSPSADDDPSRHSRTDPKLNHDATLIAYVRQRDLWITSIEGDMRLTFCADQTADRTRSCGTVEYLMQEEFHRYTGYDWGPPLASSADTCIQRILYLETTEADVDVVVIKNASPSCHHPSNRPSDAVDSVRYPRAGRHNAVSDLCIVEFIPHQQRSLVHRKLDIRAYFPWTEYIVRFGWMPHGHSTWAQLLSRDQKHTVVVEVPCDMYKETSDEETNVHVWWEEWNSAWINVSNAYHFFENTEHGDLLWSSEKSGYRHLYMVSKQGDIYPVTEGEWCVMDLSLWVDESRHLVYFMAKKDTPLEAHLYVTCYLPGQHAIRRLTQPNYHHHIAMDPIAGVVVDTLSSLFQPQTVVVRHLIYKDDDELPSVSDVDPRTRLLLPVLPRLEDMAQIMEREGPRQQLLAIPTMELPSPDLVPPIGTIRPEIFSFIHKGARLYGYLYKPRNYQAGVRYPTVLHVYGGPKTQLVTNEFRLSRVQRYMMSAYFGLAVVVVDGRGSSDRGLMFEKHLQGRLGSIELEDQIATLTFLDQTKFGAEPTKDARLESVLDLTRVAISGWSYGGYLSLMGLAQHQDIFKIAIAGAPVTDWELYDSAYTERYMGLPAENEQRYRESSVLNWIDRFPDSGNRLVIVHGLIDENVHFTNTERLVSGLVRHNKQHYLQVYPAEKHGLRHASVNEHYETLLFYWLLSYL